MTARRLSLIGTPCKSSAFVSYCTAYCNVSTRISGKNASTGFYLQFDSLQWMGETGLMKSGDLKLIKDRRNMWWLISIIFSFIAALYKYQANAKKLEADK